MRIVFDLDGTLADGTQREHFIKGETKDWEAFFEACGKDLPNQPAIDTLVALDRDDHDVEIWTGRGEGEDGSVREKTLVWLAEHADICTYDGMPKGFLETAFRVFCIPLRMRRHGDLTPDHELKRQWLKELQQAGGSVDLVFEDRQRVVDMWRAEGIPCFQVAPGNF